MCQYLDGQDIANSHDSHNDLDFGVIFLLFLDHFDATMKLDIVSSHQQKLTHAKRVYRRIIILVGNNNSDQFRNQRERMIGEHFKLRGPSQTDMQLSMVEKMYRNSDQFRKQRERMFISKFNTKYKGINKKTWTPS